MSIKIKNAERVSLGDIKFRSKLEKYAYETFLANNFDFEYEKHKFLLMEGFEPTNLEIMICPKSKTDRKTLVSKKTKQRNITYTPDFRIKVGNRVFYIESKGFPNDSFPLKKKLFLKLLNDMNDGNIYSYLEPTNQRQVRECVTIINELCQK